MIPPADDAEFAAWMGEVLETYELPCDPERPVICMDEQPVQLVKETRAPLAATGEHPERVDYEFERAGTAAVFLFCEPLRGRREGPPASVARRRTGGSRWPPCRRALRGLQEGDSGAGLRQHARDGGLLLGLRARPRQGHRSPHRVLPHAEARQLAEHSRERTQCDDSPVPGRTADR